MLFNNIKLSLIYREGLLESVKVQESQGEKGVAIQVILFLSFWGISESTVFGP